MSRQIVVMTHNIVFRIQELEYRQAQRIIISSIIGIIAWGLLTPFFLLDFIDPIFWRSLLVLLSVVVLMLGSQVRHRKETASGMILIFGTVFLLHTTYLAKMNEWPIMQVVLDYIILIFAFMHMSERKFISIWATIAALFAIYLATQKVQDIHPTAILIISFALIVATLISSSYRSQIFAELRKAEQSSSRIFESMHEGLMIFSKDGKLQSWNHAAWQILHLPEEQFDSIQFQSLFREQITETGQKFYKNKIFKYHLPDEKHIWISFSTVPLREGQLDDKISLTLMTFQDVTALKENELLIQQQERMLSVKGRFNALGEMAAGIAHEINNPLAILVGRVAQIRRLILNNSHEKQIEVVLLKIDDTIRRISRIIQSMKSLSRDGQNDPFEKIKLLTIIEDTMVLIKEKLESAGVQISILVEPTVELECRPAQISQVILNMLHNSKDAIDRLPEKWIELKATEGGDFVRLSVTDSGPGIPEEVRKKMMQPFFTTKDIGKGTGLGLSITTNIIRTHQGELSIDEKSPNTCFVITLPKIQQRDSVAV